MTKMLFDAIFGREFLEAKSAAKWPMKAALDVARTADVALCTRGGLDSADGMSLHRTTRPEPCQYGASFEDLIWGHG